MALAKKEIELSNAGKPSEAVPFAERHLQLSEKLFGPQHPITAMSLSMLANFYDMLGNYAKAEPLLRRAIEIDEKVFGPWNAATATSLTALALLYTNKGDYAEAEPLYQRALAINEKAFGSEHSVTAMSLANLAYYYQTIGDNAKAESLYQQALALNEKARDPMHSEANTAQNLNQLADLYRVMGDFSKAEPLLERALAIREKVLGPQHPVTAANLNSLAMLYKGMGDYARAEPLYQRALAIHEKALGPLHTATAEVLANLGELYRLTGDCARAEPLYQRALAIHEKTDGPWHLDTALSLNSLGVLYWQMGEYAKAEPLCQRALEISTKALGPEHPVTATTLNYLGLIDSAMGDNAKAEPLYRRAVAIWEKALGPEHPDTATGLTNLALLEITLGKAGEALELVRRLDKANTANLGNILSFTSEQQRLAFQRKVGPFNVPATMGNEQEIAEVVLRNKGVVLDSLLEDRVVTEASQNTAQRAVIERLRKAKQQLTQILLEAPKDLSAEALRRRDAERETRARQVEQLEAGLAREVTGFGKARRALTVTVGQVQGALASDHALVEMLRYLHHVGDIRWEPRYGAVVITPTGEARWVPLGAATEIEKHVMAYGKSVRAELDETTFRTTLRALYDQLWAPIEKALPPGIKTVILSPDGDLNFVSFATLIAPDQGFLAEKYSLRYVASGRDLLREVSPSTSKLMAIFGDPDFGGEMKLARNRSVVKTSSPLRAPELRDFSRIVLPRLPGTATECAALKSQSELSGAEPRLFLDADATEAKLRQIVSPRILHLATHGFFLPEAKDPQSGKDATAAGMQPIGASGAPEKAVLLKNPMHRSGLALAGAQRTLDAWAKGDVPPSDNDGIVTAEEVGGLKLQGTWLVTLSACDTGAGEARAGEGVMGLRRGFIQAGAQNLLMTLWEISDETTVEIMKDFYARALKTGNAPQALADTQREWLVKLRKEKGLAEAVTLAGPFIMNSQGKQ
jgi:CHAT domain-containing protein/Tfp pilus assembly protein PilF